MKKQLNVDAIASELRGNSAFFPGYKSPRKAVESTISDEKPVLVRPATPSEQGVPPAVPPVVPLPVPRTESLVRKKKREIKQRQPFDVYWDQYLTLKKIADAESDFVNGRGMSQMVREAIDVYLKTHNIPLEKHPK